MHWTALQIAIITLFPFISRRLHLKGLLPYWLSPVVLCYALGILLSNLSLFPLREELSTTFTEFTIVMAIPLLLYATNLKHWLKHARASLLSFFLCVLAGIAATAFTAFLLHQRVHDAWRLSGMLVGIYTGGTPNMQAIGLALEASQEAIILLNTADVLMGGTYLLFLTSVAPRAYGWLFPPFSGNPQLDVPEAEQLQEEWAINYRHSTLGIALTLVIIALSLGISHLVFGNLQNVSFIILLLTSLSIVASFLPAIRRLENTFETGEYFLLMFCVALGMLADFSVIVGRGLDIILYCGLAMIGTIIMHLLLAYFFRIDRDTLLFTSVAALYGPAFIGQMASITGNRQLIFSGIAMGLLGYAIGNYLGIGLAYGLKALL